MSEIEKFSCTCTSVNYSNTGLHVTETLCDGKQGLNSKGGKSVFHPYDWIDRDWHTNLPHKPFFYRLNKPLQNMLRV